MFHAVPPPKALPNRFRALPDIHKKCDVQQKLRWTESRALIGARFMWSIGRLSICLHIS